MLKPAEMDKIRVIGLRKDMDAIVALIHDLGVVQFRKYADARLSEEKPSEAYSAVSEQLVKLEALVAALKPRPVEGTSKVLPVEQLVSESGRLVSEVEPRLVHARERLDELELELRDLTEVSSILKGLKDFDMNLSVMESRELCFFMGRIPNSKIGELEAAISSVTDKHALRCRKTSSLESVCAVVAERKSREQIAAALQKLAFAEARLPQIEGTPYAIGTDVGGKIRQLEKEKAALETEVDKLSDRHYAQAAILLEMLRIQADRLYAITNFSGTGYTFALEGWVPSSDCGRVEAALKERFGGDVIMEHRKGGHDQPTMLLNPNALGPFEFMVEFISLPRGYEIDPTLLFALGFPIIYGMMLGDAGYGLVSFVIALLVSRKFKGTMLEPIGKVWALVALPTVIFGFIYNEYFGFKLDHLIGEHACGMIPRIFGFSLCEGMPRMENITLLLLATLFVGIAHLAIGFMLGALNKYREGETWHAAAKIAWIGVEFAGVALVATIMFRALPDWVVAPSALVALAAIAVIIKVEGVLGLIEIPGLASNIFSYARILAVGIASVVVAELINELLLPSPDKGIVAVIILIPVYIGLHLFNVVLGMFESLVQGARLNYVEFFSKFYEGGGSRFNPFKYAKHFTK